MLVGVYLDPRQSSTTSKSAENGSYEAFVTVLYLHFINELGSWNFNKMLSSFHKINISDYFHITVIYQDFPFFF